MHMYPHTYRYLYTHGTPYTYIHMSMGVRWVEEEEERETKS